MEIITINLLTIIAEISLVFIFFFLVDWCFGKLYRQFLIKFPILQESIFTNSKIRNGIRHFLFLLSLAISSIIIIINGFLIYRGENVFELSLMLFHRIPIKFWQQLGLGIAKSLVAILIGNLILKILNFVLNKLSKYAQNFDNISANDKSVGELFNTFKNNINTFAWIGIAILCGNFLFLPSFLISYLYIFLRIYIIVSISLLVFRFLIVIIDSLDGLSLKFSKKNNILELYEQMRYLIPFVKFCLEYIVYFSIATLALKQLNFLENLINWGIIAIKFILIILLTRLLISFIYLILDKILLDQSNLTIIQQKRRQTITPLIKSVSKYFIYFSAAIILLETIGVNPAPILAGAGVVGLALSLGAQNLVNDIVSGFFILFENHYLVGDYIESEQASGYIEAIELRTTRIRHENGQVYILRNGDINTIVNYSIDYVYAVVDLGVDYNTNLTLVFAIIQRTGALLKEENHDILESTQVIGVEEFGDIRLSIHTKTKVKPGKHLEIQRILRKVFKEAFDRENIYIPIGETTTKDERLIPFQEDEGRVSNS